MSSFMHYYIFLFPHGTNKHNVFNKCNVALIFQNFRNMVHQHLILIFTFFIESVNSYSIQDRVFFSQNASTTKITLFLQLSVLSYQYKTAV